MVGVKPGYQLIRQYFLLRVKEVLPYQQEQLMLVLKHGVEEVVQEAEVLALEITQGLAAPVVLCGEYMNVFPAKLCTRMLVVVVPAELLPV
jgi:hypothetical protein